ncbi:MAG: class I SAM-dependent methyltransferase [bacterium]
MVVERDIVSNYERWFLSPAGMYTDDKEKELLINSIRFKRSERVLEIGCGTGRNLEYLCDLGLEAVGVEPVEELIKKARQKSTIKNEQLIRCPYEKLPLGNGSFDNVIFMNTFGFAFDKKAALKEAFRVAAKKVAIGFLNKNSLSKIFKVRERRAVYNDSAPLSGTEITTIIKEALGVKDISYKYTVKYTLYMPITVGYLFPFADDVLEKINLPLGDFGMVVITKK